jgi:sulfonate transport system substrate-binding protein
MVTRRALPILVLTAWFALPLCATSARVVKIPRTPELVVAQEKGWLAEEFAPCGARVELVEGAAWNTNPPMFERGELNIGTSMTYPIVMQMLMGFDPVIIWQSLDINPRNVSVLVLKNSPIKTLADLKGRQLGIPRYQCPYFGAFETLKANGLALDTQLAPGDVRYVNIMTQPAAQAALLAGRVDAIAVHPTSLTRLYQDDLIREIATAVPNGGYVHGDRTIQLAPRKWARANPDLVRAYIRVYNRSRVWVQRYPAEAAAIAAPVLRQPKDVLEDRIREPGSNGGIQQETSYAHAVESLLFFQRWAIQNGDDLLSRNLLTQERIEAMLDPRFFKGGDYYAGDPPPMPEESASFAARTIISDTGLVIAEVAPGPARNSRP